MPGALCLLDVRNVLTFEHVSTVIAYEASLQQIKNIFRAVLILRTLKLEGGSKVVAKTLINKLFKIEIVALEFVFDEGCR